MKRFSLFVLLFAFCLRPSAFAQGTAGPSGACCSNYGAFIATFNIPFVQWGATGLTLTYTGGTIYQAGSASSITGSTLSLTNSKGTCTLAGIQAGSCNLVYFASGTALASTVTYATASASGNRILYFCATSGGNITGCTSATQDLYVPAVAAAGSGTVTNVATTSPITGGPITTTGTIACATCAIGPGSSTANHLATFSGTDGLTLADGGAVPTGTTVTVASGATALNTAAIASAACDTVVSPTATGTATTDAVMVSFNADPTGVTGYIPSTSGMLTIMVYPTSGHVNFKVCNNTGASITPGAITLNWRVVR